MGWTRTKALTTELPAPPSLMRWLLLGALAVIAGVLLFILHASGEITVLSTLNIWLVSLTPPVLWFLSICTRGWLWGREVDRHNFLQHEADYGQQQWENWAGRHLAVLDSCLFLPDKISVAALNEPLPVQYGMVRRVDYFQHKKEACSALLRKFQQTLDSRPPALPLRVTLLTDLPTESVAEVFHTAWVELFPDHAVPEDVCVTTHLSFAQVEDRLKQPTLTVDLIVVMQMNGGEQYSDALAALLLTSDDVAEQYHLPHTARLLRPMPLNVSAIDTDFPLFFDTQTVALSTSRIVGDSLEWEAIMATLMTHGAAKGANWRPEERLILEQFCGIPGPFSPWLLSALAADMVTLSQQSLLTLFSSGEEHFISTVTTGSAYEHIG